MKNSQKQFSLDHIKGPLYSNKFPIIIFYAPKCGCTSLTKWFLYQMGEDNIDNIRKIHNYCKNEYYIPNKNEIIKSLKGKEKVVYKLIRNPYTRAVSIFFHTVKHKILQDEINVDATKGLSFKFFLQTLTNYNLQHSHINNHFAYQYTEGVEHLIDHYIKLESFNKHIRQIEAKYNLKNSPLHELTKSNHHNRSNMKLNEQYADTKLYTKQIIKNEPIPSYDCFYDKETKSLVEKLYKVDFEAYSYPLNVIK
ncbi:sulfotransferase family 2 domain-containing protein [Bacillus carboniphilus]|uniref:Sulfotransferase family 2 domain-containing protein n=1 Tax=Bacillus carboniphilus TaxID=86663 RepID=A0ABY9JZQ0_9BACI|nr:sulfotransferase family 2 domain-containing protein [Bacillus carboniphilus]WLR43111.1 sulfotransferase family 2 domain-containing protein [Bacillus carboniphilus]